MPYKLNNAFQMTYHSHEKCPDDTRGRRRVRFITTKRLSQIVLLLWEPGCQEAIYLIGSRFSSATITLAHQYQSLEYPTGALGQLDLCGHR